MEKARVEAYQSKRFFDRYFLECILFLYTVGTTLYLIPIGTLMSKKLCLYEYGYNESVCEHIEEADRTIKDPVLDITQFYGFINDVVINVPGELRPCVKCVSIDELYLTNSAYGESILFRFRRLSSE